MIEELIKKNGVRCCSVRWHISLGVLDDHRVLQLWYDVPHRSIQLNFSLLNELQSCNLCPRKKSWLEEESYRLTVTTSFAMLQTQNTLSLLTSSADGASMACFPTYLMYSSFSGVAAANTIAGALL